jgi:hypothetical protein
VSEPTPKAPGGIAVKPAELIDLIRVAASNNVASLIIGDIRIEFAGKPKLRAAGNPSVGQPAAGQDWYNQEPPPSAIND